MGMSFRKNQADIVHIPGFFYAVNCSKTIILNDSFKCGRIV